MRIELCINDVRTAVSRDNLAALPLLIRGEGTLIAELSTAEIVAGAWTAIEFYKQKIPFQIKQLNLSLTSADKHSLHVSVWVSLAKSIISGAAYVSATIHLEEPLGIRISDVKYEGDGVVGTVLSPVIRHYLRQYEQAHPIELPEVLPVNFFSPHIEVANGDLRAQVGVRGKIGDESPSGTGEG